MLPCLILEPVFVAFPVSQTRFADLHLEREVDQVEDLQNEPSCFNKICLYYPR